MRTTLDIDEEVLMAAKELAARRKSTAGKVISELARSGLQNRTPERTEVDRNGFRLLPPGGVTVTSGMVEELLDDDI